MSTNASLEPISTNASLASEEPVFNREMTTTAEVARLVQDFYPGNQMPVRNLRILEDILEAKVAGQTYRQDIGW